jgi:hypothetical protein
MRSKPFVGITADGTRDVFRGYAPTEATHGHLYIAVIGPFRTARGARFMRDYGRMNPHCQTVQDAERLAKRLAADNDAFDRGVQIGHAIARGATA